MLRRAAMRLRNLKPLAGRRLTSDDCSFRAASGWPYGLAAAVSGWGFGYEHSTVGRENATEMAIALESGNEAISGQEQPADNRQPASSAFTHPTPDQITAADLGHCRQDEQRQRPKHSAHRSDSPWLRCQTAGNRQAQGIHRPSPPTASV